MKGDVKRNISPPTGCGFFCLDSQPRLSSWPRPNAVLLPCRQRRERAPPPSLWECGNRAPLFLARFPSAVETVEKSDNSEATILAEGRLFHGDDVALSSLGLRRFPRHEGAKQGSTSEIRKVGVACGGRDSACSG